MRTTDENKKRSQGIIKNLGQRFIDKVKTISSPGFERIPIYYVITYFFRGFKRGSMDARGSAIAFSLLFAILPTTIFLFSLIPFVPIQNFQSELLKLFQQILPASAYDFLETSLIEVITQKSRGLLIIMFGATIIFSSTGMHRLINVFNISQHPLETRDWLNQRKIALILVFVITILLTIAVITIIFSNTIIGKLVNLNIIEKDIVFYLAQTAKWIIITALIFFSISFIYYFALAKRKNWRFFSVGSIVATFLFILSSLGVSFFVNHFGRFNKLYGSIGSLMVVLIWLYFNSISILIGFELNASIHSANLKKKIYLTKNSSKKVKSQ